MRKHEFSKLPKGGSAGVSSDRTPLMATRFTAELGSTSGPGFSVQK